MRKLFKRGLPIWRLFVVLLLAVGTFTFAMFQGGIVSWTIFYVFIPFALYAVLLFLFPLSTVKVHRDLTQRYFKRGEELVVKLTIQRPSIFPLVYVVVTDEWQESERKQRLSRQQKLLFFGLNKEVTWTYTIPELPRGSYEATHITLEVTDFLGLMKKRQSLKVHSTMLVYPSTMNLSFQTFEVEGMQSASSSLFKSLSDPSSIAGVREYVEGDRMSLVHWKMFAKTSMLMTKEFERKSANQIVLLFDPRANHAFEDRVTLVASLAENAVKSGTTIHFQIIGQEDQVERIEANQHLQQVLNQLAKIQPILHTDVFRHIKLFERKSSVPIVLVSGFVDEDLYEQLMKGNGLSKTIHHLIVLADDEVMSDQLRQQVQTYLKRGIVIQPIKHQQFAEVFKGGGR